MKEFNNDASMVGFIGEYHSVDEVIALDTRELLLIGGCFEAIADRMKQVLDYVESHSWSQMVDHKFDDKLKLVSVLYSKGLQFCPFNGCRTKGWNEAVTIQNPMTRRGLMINRGVEHLVREHHLLEKGNAYGISAREFYENFM